MGRRWRVLIILLAFSRTPLIVLTPLIYQEKWLATGTQTAVLEALGDFRGKCDQEDDITMVVIKVE